MEELAQDPAPALVPQIIPESDAMNTLELFKENPNLLLLN